MYFFYNVESCWLTVRGLNVGREKGLLEPWILGAEWWVPINHRNHHGKHFLQHHPGDDTPGKWFSACRQKVHTALTSLIHSWPQIFTINKRFIFYSFFYHINYSNTILD